MYAVAQRRLQHVGGASATVLRPTIHRLRFCSGTASPLASPGAQACAPAGRDPATARRLRLENPPRTPIESTPGKVTLKSGKAPFDCRAIGASVQELDRRARTRHPDRVSLCPPSATSCHPRACDPQPQLTASEGERVARVPLFILKRPHHQGPCSVRRQGGRYGQADCLVNALDECQYVLTRDCWQASRIALVSALTCTAYVVGCRISRRICKKTASGR